MDLCHNPGDKYCDRKIFYYDVMKMISVFRITQSALTFGLSGQRTWRFKECFAGGPADRITELGKSAPLTDDLDTGRSVLNTSLDGRSMSPRKSARTWSAIRNIE